MDQLSLYDSDTYEHVLQRIDALSHDSQPGWGTMTAAQMLSHCAEILEVSNGKALQNSPWFVRLFKGVIRKQVVGPKPYPRSSATHPQYVISDPRDFSAEQKRLLEALDAMKVEGPDGASKTVHALFGRMTADEKGWAMYKHLDHHLSQFGV